MRRFFLAGPLTEKILIQDEDAHHIIRVLRLKTGDKLIVADPAGEIGEYSIDGIAPEGVKLTLLQRIAANNEPPVNVCLAQGLLKGEKMDYIVQKAVEIGVNMIIPMLTSHCVVQYDNAKKSVRVERWQKIAREAAKQCGRNIIPTVLPVQSLTEVVENSGHNTTAIMFYEKDAPETLKGVLTSHPSANYMVIVGPEGGFSLAELTLCRKANFHIATLGPRILRADTAALSAVTAVMYQCGDLGSATRPITEV